MPIMPSCLGQPTVACRVAEGVEFYLQFGTMAVRDYCEAQGYSQTFQRVGATVLLPDCGACANSGPGASLRPDQVTVSAQNRNFPGRSGPGQIWLASPPTVAASAIGGGCCRSRSSRRVSKSKPSARTRQAFRCRNNEENASSGALAGLKVLDL